LRGNFIQLVVHRPTRDHGATTPLRVTAETPGTENFIGYDAFRGQIDGWLQGIASGTEPELSGRSVVPLVKLIEQCYSRRSAAVEPWTDAGLTSPTTKRAPTTRRRVLVTGAGGFLGCRTVELLAQGYGYDAVALIKEPKSAARLARWPTEILL